MKTIAVIGFVVVLILNIIYFIYEFITELMEYEFATYTYQCFVFCFLRLQ